ncbi:hypothetical protein [Pseudohalioglobus lutimaris]|nr:hypothetical protein [Pseudohalioglobus lutimaris]
MMRFKNLTPALLFAALAAGCASNQDSDTAASSTSAGAGAEQQVAMQADVEDPNAIRCKRYAETGSRIGKKVCMTNAEWDRTAQESREAADRIQRGSLHGTSIVDGG